MPRKKELCYEFGPFRLSVANRVLKIGDEPISITPKATEILLVLLRSAGEIVEKEELMTEVWPDSFVEEANLTQNIFTLRRALDDRSDNKYIETVSRRGYRFIGLVKTVETFPSASGQVSDHSPPILAVLPFINASGKEELEYLADGVTDNIINSLSQTSKLRVLSRSAAFRFKSKEIDPRNLADELNVNTVLLGKIVNRASGLTINAELVDARTSCLIWGEGFDCEVTDILEIQNEMACQISAALRLKLTREEETRITARYTESSRAYQAYIEGRFYWSRYTREGIEKAIKHFREAIEFDPKYALAYAGIIDCYLRLATNYLPVETGINSNLRSSTKFEAISSNGDSKIRLRHHWDWKAAERELRRANELRTDYPAAHQWYSAFRIARHIYESCNNAKAFLSEDLSYSESTKIPFHIASAQLTPSEEVQVLCTIAREQVVVGNYEGGSLILEQWAPKAHFWPNLDRLTIQASADLLFTLGIVIGCQTISGRIHKGQKRAESFLSGAVALLEHLGSKIRAAEARIELARCYYREGLLDEAREILAVALAHLPNNESELRGFCLILRGILERDSGKLADSLSSLEQALTESTGQLMTGRSHLEIATTLKELAVSDSQSRYHIRAIVHFEQALYELEAIGDHRNAAAAQNNFGYLLLCLGQYGDAEIRLARSLDLFLGFSDQTHSAQVRETLSNLFLEMGNLSEARKLIDLAVVEFERSDSEALLAESLITKGSICCKQNQYVEARMCFEGSFRISERCGDRDGTARALFKMLDEMSAHLDVAEVREVSKRLKYLLPHISHLRLKEKIDEVLVRVGQT